MNTTAIKNARHELLAAHLATGGTVRSWAEAQGVPLRTAYDWAGRDEVRDRVKVIQDGLLREALGKLLAVASQAIQTLEDHLAEGTGSKVRVAAARIVLTQLLRVREHADLAERIAELEERVKNGNRDRRSGTSRTG